MTRIDLKNPLVQTLNLTPSATPSTLLNKRLWGLLVVGLVIHLVFGWLLTFSIDEAHYAYYAFKLDFSYFDHPPLVGWIQWPLVALGAADGLIRLIPETLWLLSCLLARNITLDLAPTVPGWSDPSTREAAGAWAVALILLAPLMHVLAVGLLPDTLLMTLSLALMQLTIRLATAAPGQRHLLRWCLLGLLLGLAGLAKYTAVLPAMAVIIILLWRGGFNTLLQVGPWLALLIAATLVAPVFYWNARHDWISFVYQLNHGTGGAWQARRLAAFVGIQLAAYGPLLIFGSILGIRHVLKTRAWHAAGLLLFFLIPFAVTALLAGGGGSLPHWTAPAWLAITPFAALAIATRWQQGKRHLIQTLVWLQASLCLLAFTILFFAGIPGIDQKHALGKKNPIADLWGWEQAGARAQKLAAEQQLASVAVSNWTLASRMAWYARPLPIYVLDSRFDQFDLWFGQISAGSDSLFVNWSQMRFDLPTKAGGFESCTLLETLEYRRLGRTISDFSFYHCRNWGAAVAPADSGKSR